MKDNNQQPAVAVNIESQPFSPDTFALLAKKVGLHHLAAHPEIITEIAKAGLGVERGIQYGLAWECNQRHTQKAAMNLKMAKFPEDAMTLENFDFSVSNVDKAVIDDLAKCEWIARHRNVLFHGSTGLGKTHLAVALGKKAIVDAGYSVRFYKANELMGYLNKAVNHGDFEAKLKLINRADLIIVDDFGHSTMVNQPNNAGIFYEFIDSRYHKKSILITTNRRANQWPKFLSGDLVGCKACLDRFLHEVTTQGFKGQSYRLNGVREKRLSKDPLEADLAKSLTDGQSDDDDDD